MDRLRHVLGMDASPPPMSHEQTAVAERQRRIRERQKAIDIQVEVLAADRRDARRR
jgi:hypothetical protein